jgi:hypothetical protein
LLKFKCGRPHRHPIVIRRDPQQLELRFGAVEGLSYPSAFFGAGAIPVTERKTIVLRVFLVGFWHLADVEGVATNVHFWG